MEIASLVFKHNFDKAMLEQIDTLRTVRLNLAEKMLREIDKTSEELHKRGLVGPKGVDKAELKDELTSRIRTLRDRLQRPDVVYTDEISMYADLLSGVDGDDDEADSDE